MRLPQSATGCDEEGPCGYVTSAKVSADPGTAPIWGANPL